ncbi:MAG: DUF6531 domain-containing protein, partial [Syntrophorhabdaceae bacterium]|nr:DUF6531 domain-containing protein [Syntrophorhabdaceae bacterium]
AAYTRYCAAKSVDIETKAALGSWIVNLQQKAGGSPAASEPEAKDVSGSGAQQSLDNALDEIREYALPSGLFITFNFSMINKFMNDNPELSKILTDNGISIITYMRFRQAKIENGATEQDVNAWLMDLQQKAGQAPVTGKSSAINDITGKYGPTADSGKPANNTAQTTGGYNVTAIDPGIMNIINITSDTEDSGGGGGGTLWNGPAMGDNIYTTKLSDYLTDYFGLPVGLTYEDLAAMGILDDVKKDYVPLDPDRAGPQSGDGTGTQQGGTTDQGSQGTDTAGDSTGQDNTGENGTTDDTGEPVSVPEGFFYSTERDLKGNYPCHNLERHYNSMRRTDRGFGKGWSTGYSWDLTVGVRGKAVVVLTSDWKELVYEFDSTVNGYVAVKPSNFAVLKQNDENFILEYPDGIKCFFEPVGRGGSFRITRMEDPEGVRFVYSYGKVTGFLEKVTDKLSNSVSFEYNEVGHIIKAKDNAGREINYAYSSLTGAVTGVKRPDGSAVKYSYDSRGNMSDKVFADGTILVTTYDRSRRVLKQFLDKKLVYEFKYNDKDNHIEYYELGKLVKNYYYNDKKCLTKITSFDNGTEEKVYNDRELVVKYIDQKGRATEFTYDDNGNIAQKVLPNGAKEAFSYDKYSRLVKYTNPLGYSTEVSYNGAGKPEKLTDADGNVTAFSYDNNNYLTAMALPDGGKISYVRDDKGNALSVDNNGVVNKYEYDALGNVKKEYSASGLVTECAYNPDNEPVMVVKKTQADSFGMSYEYDAFGNITKITDPLKRVTSIKWTKGFFNRMEEVTDPSGNIIRLNYNETGRLISKADRNNNGWSYTYDPLGRLTAVEDPAKSRMLAQYDLAGNITAQTDFDGVKKEFEYDDLNRITAIRTEGKTDRKVEYDLAGRAARVIDANGNAICYKYNKLGKVLETADAEGAITKYAYDKMGRTCAVTDGNGNTTNYAYNKLGRTESITDPLGHKTAFSYDAAGRLSEKTLADGSKIKYSYDEFGRTAKIT